MRKKIIALLITETVALSLTACGVKNRVVEDENAETKLTATFERHILNEGYGYSILVDKETKVCYLEYEGIEKYGITVMLNADGTPKIWEED